MNSFSSNTLAKKTALITGAGGLLGPQHGIGLSSAGAKVILTDIDEEGLERSKKKILDFNKNAIVETYILDITNLESVENFENTYVKKINILIF